MMGDLELMKHGIYIAELFYLNCREAGAEEKFKEISNAYEVEWSDPCKMHMVDYYLLTTELATGSYRIW